MSFNSIEEEMLYDKPIDHGQDINGTNSMHIIELGDNCLEDDQSSMVEENITIFATDWDESADHVLKTVKKRVNAGMDASNIIDDGKTRGQTSKQFDWVLEQDASRVARAKVHRVGTIKREASHSPLAPLNSTLNNGSLYVEVPWANVEDMFSYWTMGDQQTHAKLLASRYKNPKLFWPEAPPFGEDKRVWVPLAFLYLLTQKDNPWTDLEKMRDEALPSVHNTIFKIKTEHKLFSLKTSGGFKKASPAKDEAGNIKTRQRQNGEEVEDELWLPLRDDFGQLILWEHRFRDRKCKSKGVFDYLIKKVNEKESINGGTAVFRDVNDPVPDDYQFLSEHPFGLYRTYIKSTSYDAYMKQLLAGCFATDQEERAIYDPIPDASTGTTPDIIDPRGVPKDIEKLIEDLKPIHEEMKKRSQNKTDARADGLKAVELGDRRANIKEASTGDIQTKTFVNITAEKAQLARGARKREKASQGVVMGESASKRCVKYFGWKWTSPAHRSKTWPTIPPKDPALPVRVMPFRENEMYNGLFIAEWLHLSAYSWGGLADPKWEKAWQKLVQTEGEMLASEGEDGSQYGGLLTITRHPFEFRAPNAAAQAQRRMVPYLHKGTYASYLHDVAIPTPEDPQSPFRYVVRRKQWTPELEALAKEFRWICFQFDYDIKLNGASKLLDLPAGCVKGQNRFYPFRRMLFHKIEHDLDSELWKDLKREAVDGLRSEYDGRKYRGILRIKKTRRCPWEEWSIA
ncbi:hypothetical protein FDENT_13406 [Fusarium denticulatum]|uniref:Uncharacterized protein n=1 Tax=Fusarium denticulatum TaxID=48507 RepID=A0A8H5SY25_9HYPO|nr:hypothetical protein FDENT_13406 [Fusarium denticulatum]